MKKIRILVADDHKIVLDGLKSLLEPDFEVVGAVENGRDLVDQARKLHPDVIVTDISMPLLNGIDATRQIKKLDESMKVVLLTMHDDPTYAVSAMESGAKGYVMKHSATSELLTAINQVFQGRTYITPLIAGEVIRSLKEGKGPENLLSALSPRQREVLQLLVEGKTAKEIATILNISVRTAEFHKYQIMAKLKIKKNTELVQFAIKNGIISI